MSLDQVLDAYAAKKKAKGVKPRMLKEVDIEVRITDRVKALGGIPFKFTSPSRRSVPDRLCLLPVPDCHRDIVRRYVRFIEAKKPGEVASQSQHREHERLRALGFYVAVIDTRPGADAEFPKQPDLFD